MTARFFFFFFFFFEPFFSPTLLPAPCLEPPLPEDLVVCLGAEPTNLYLSSDDSIAATAIRRALRGRQLPRSAPTIRRWRWASCPAWPTATRRCRRSRRMKGIWSSPPPANWLRWGKAQRSSMPPVRPSPMTAGKSPCRNWLSILALCQSHGLVRSRTGDGRRLRLQLRGRPRPVDATPRRRDAHYCRHGASGERCLRWTGLPGYLDPASVTLVASCPCRSTSWATSPRPGCRHWTKPPAPR